MLPQPSSQATVVHFLTVWFLIAQMSLPVVGAQAQLPNKLSPGQTLERKLKGGQTHAYSVEAEAGKFLEITVQQQGVNVIVALVSPDGQTLAEVNRPSGPVGSETMLLFSEGGGAHRVLVRAAHQNSLEAR